MTSTIELTHDTNLESGDAAAADVSVNRTAPPDAEAVALVEPEPSVPDAATLRTERDEGALRTRPATKAAGALAVDHADQALTFADVSARQGGPADQDGNARRDHEGTVRVPVEESADAATTNGRGGDHSGDNGDDGGEPGDTGGEDDRGEEGLRRAYSRFAADIAQKRAAAEALGEPITAHVTDSVDPAGEAQYETRFVLPTDAAARAQEDARYEALVRARQIEDPMAELDLQQIEAYDDSEGQIVTRVVEGKRLNELTDDEKRLITESEIHGALNTIEAMVQAGVVPNRDYGNTISINPISNRLQFSDYDLLEHTDADPEHPILTTGDAFMRVMEAFRDPATRGTPEGAAGERLRDLSQHVLRDHFMYRGPNIAYNTETLDPDEIKTVYAHTEPQRSTTTHDLHVASHMHDMALASKDNEESRLNMLGNAQEAYEISIYQSVLDNKGDIHQVLRTDDQGRNLLLTNDHVLQARLALAFWPVSEARVRDEDLSTGQRQEINHNLAVVIGEMMPGGEAPQPSYERQFTHRGFLNQVTAMTALSRVRPNVDTSVVIPTVGRVHPQEDTSVAIPTSEARRLYAGPDAAVLFEDEGDYAMDIDWKLRGEGGPDTVNVGNICFTEVAKEATHPYDEGQDKAEQDWLSVVHVARLLHDEQLGSRPLEPEESALLDRVQRALWGTIETKARQFYGIDNLRERARF